MELYLRRYSHDSDDQWDRLVAASWNGTFLHTRRYLSYHGDRFHDVSLVLNGTGGKTIGVFPAAVDPDDQDLVVSHPGITYGGIVHAGSLLGTEMISALQLICDYYRGEGYRALRYKAVPHIYHRKPGADDLYALFRLGAVRYRCDLSSTIDLAERSQPARDRRYRIRKAQQSGATVEVGPGYIGPFWRVLEGLLEDKFGAKPVHSLQEILLLQSMFPSEIVCIVGMINGGPVAGAVVFDTPSAMHLQYSAANQDGYRLSVMDLVLEHCIEQARASGKRYFDFGISNEREGTVLNESLYRFKSGFGGGGVVYEFYEIRL